MTLIRRAPYNHEVIVAGRWRIPYAPAYGWTEYVRGIYKAVVRTDPAYSDSAIRGLIERSSLGTPEAKAIRARTPPEVARTIAIASTRVGELQDERDRLRAVADAAQHELDAYNALPLIPSGEPHEAWVAALRALHDAALELSDEPENHP